MQRIQLTCSITLACLAVAGASARADTVYQYTAGTSANSSFIMGQKFIDSAAYPENNIAASFVLGDPASLSTLSAPGIGYLLSQSYTGTPSALGSGTPGYLGQATGSSGVYTFPASLVLQPGTTYYLYENAAISNLYSGAVPSGDGDALAISTSSTFGAPFSGFSYNMNVTGTSAVPEPASLGLFGIGGLGLLRRRSRRAVGI